MKISRGNIQTGRLQVVGAVYDFRNDLGKGHGRVILVNVNGERDPQKFNTSRLVRLANQSH